MAGKRRSCAHFSAPRRGVDAAIGMVQGESEETHMEVLIAIELALMLILAFKARIGNIERELKRKPIRYDDIG